MIAIAIYPSLLADLPAPAAAAAARVQEVARGFQHHASQARSVMILMGLMMPSLGGLQLLLLQARVACIPLRAQ